MQQFFWLDHIGSLDQGIGLANELAWNLSIAQVDGMWFVHSGEKVIFKADNRDAVDAFVYGLSLAYAALPPHLFDALRDGMKALVE